MAFDTINNSMSKFFGVAIPMIPSVGGGFSQTTTTLDQAKYNIINLISTEKGERYFRPSYGVSVKKYIFENFTNGSTDIDDYIQDEIKSAVKRWLPYVTITKTKSLVDLEAHKVFISIDFFIHDNKFDTSRIQINIDI